MLLRNRRSAAYFRFFWEKHKSIFSLKRCAVAETVGQEVLKFPKRIIFHFHIWLAVLYDVFHTGEGEGGGAMNPLSSLQHCLVMGSVSTANEAHGSDEATDWTKVRVATTRALDWTVRVRSLPGTASQIRSLLFSDQFYGSDGERCQGIDAHWHGSRPYTNLIATIFRMVMAVVLCVYSCVVFECVCKHISVCGCVCACVCVFVCVCVMHSRPWRVMYMYFVIFKIYFFISCLARLRS